MVDVLDKCLPLDRVRSLDTRLSALGRGQAALRLRVGDSANVLGRRGWFAELGFARAGDYAMQRCGKTSGWFTECRSVARHLEKLPALRAAVCRGELSWSMAVLCARKTIPEREAEVLKRAQASTVRQMRAYFGQILAVSNMPDMQAEPSRWASWEELDLLAMCDEEGAYRECDQASTCTAPPPVASMCCSGAGDAVSCDEGGSEGPFGERFFNEGIFDDGLGEKTELDDDAACMYDRVTRRSLQRTVPEAVVYKLEATRILLDHLESGTASRDQIMEGMLAEAQTKLGVRIDLHEMQRELAVADQTRRNWLSMQRAWAEAAHASCEARLAPPEPADVLLDAGPIPDTPEEIDAEIVGLCETLAARDLEMGQLAERIVAADGWRRMGLADLGQYARERVGVSKRTLEQKMRLARQVRRFPAVGEALERKAINVEAALRISGIASEESVDAL